MALGCAKYFVDYRTAVFCLYPKSICLHWAVLPLNHSTGLCGTQGGTFPPSCAVLCEVVCHRGLEVRVLGPAPPEAMAGLLARVNTKLFSTQTC